MHKLVSSALLVDPENAGMLSLDISSAFTSVSREHILNTVRSKVPSLVPWLHGTLGVHGDAVFQSGVSTLKWGVSDGFDQGCPMSAMLFSLGVSPLL